jgi:DNA-binding HxlR family transcriptional regulator
MEQVDSPVKLALNLLSKKWTFEILDFLLTEDGRFTDIEGQIGEISGKMLSERLKELFDLGLVSKVVSKLTPLQFSYRISDLGREVRHVFLELGVFGSKIFRDKIDLDSLDIREIRLLYTEKYDVGK